MSSEQPPQRSVASAAALIGVGNVTSRALGLIRELVIAALFGATGPTSAFRTATRVSTAVYDLLLSGATTAALVPVLSDYAGQRRHEDLSRIVSTFLNLALLALGALVGMLMLAAPLLVTVLGADAENWQLAVELTRIALPSVVLLGLSGILTALLYARRSFAAPAFTGAAYNAGIIVTALALSGQLSIHSLALGLTLGALLQVAMQLPALKGIGYLPVIDLGHPGVRLVIRLYTPVFLGMLISYAVVAIDTHLAWRTGQESVAAMAFATTLIQFPLGLVGAAASLAVLPSLARLASQADQAGEAAFVAMLLRGIKMVLLLILPVAVVLVLLRDSVVAVLFERLAFDELATQRTALALLAYSPQLPFVVVDQLLIVAFYARKQTLTPVLVGVGCAAVYLVVALATVAPLGMAGLALANAVQNSCHAVVLYVLFARARPALRSPELLEFAGRLVVAGVICAAVVGVTGTAWSSWLAEPSLPHRLIALMLVAMAGVGSYGLALIGLRVSELEDLRSLLHRGGKR